MNIVMNGPTLMLDRLQRLALVDAAGAVAQVKSGRLWITLENDRRDIVLAPGEAWKIDRDGLTLVQAEEPSTIVLTEARRRRGPVAALRAFTAALGRWSGAYSRRSLPYY